MGITDISLRVIEPYDFALSLRAIRSFQPTPYEQDDRLRLATTINGIPTLVEVSQSPGAKSRLKAFSIPRTDSNQLRSIVEWILFAELELRPFNQSEAAAGRIRLIVDFSHFLSLIALAQNRQGYHF